MASQRHKPLPAVEFPVQCTLIKVRAEFVVIVKELCLATYINYKAQTKGLFVHL